MYTCDNWVIIKFKGNDPHYRVLTGTSGGYLDGDSWRMNSGVVAAERDGEYYLFYGSSGSCYKCHKNSYMLRNNNYQIWVELKEKFGDKVQLMEDDDYDWTEMDWIIS